MITSRGVDADTSRVGATASTKVRADAEAILTSWRAGSRADALKVLAQRPDFLSDRSVALDLVLEEYCQRRAHGEDLGAATFRERFESLDFGLAHSIERLVTIERAIDDQAIARPDFEWPLPGERFEGFEIVEELGRGGLARAYLCKEEAVGERAVVVKVSPEATGEAWNLGKLSHPNIVTVYSTSRAGTSGATLVCMPFLGRLTLQHLIEVDAQSSPDRLGEWLKELLRDAGPEGEAEPEWADYDLDRKGLWNRVFQGVAAGLAHAHERGLVHGDVKPSNVLVTRIGASLIDFNLSRTLDGAACLLGGTLPYLSPEHWAFLSSPKERRAPLAQPASDMYAFAISAAHAVVGRAPDAPSSSASLSEFGASEAFDSQRLLVDRAVREIGKDTPLGIVIRRCAAPAPEDRLSAAEAASLLEGAPPSLSAPRRVGRTSRRSFFAVLSGLAASAALASVVRRSPGVDDGYSDGVSALLAGENERAAASFTEVLAIERRHFGARYSRAWANIRLDNFVEAIADLRILNDDRKDARVQAGIGYCFASQLGFAGASPWYERATGSLRGNTSFHNNLGCCLWQGRTSATQAEQQRRAREQFATAVESADSSRVTTATNRLLFESNLFSGNSPVASADALSAATKDLLTASREDATLLVAWRACLIGSEHTELRIQADSVLEQIMRRRIAPERDAWASDPAFSVVRRDPRLADTIAHATKRVALPRPTLLEHLAVHPEHPVLG